jgi:hypothetical protein
MAEAKRYSKKNHSLSDSYASDDNFKVKTEVTSKRLICKQIPLSKVFYKDNYQPNFSLDSNYLEKVKSQKLLQSLQVSFNPERQVYELISDYKRYAAMMKIYNDKDILVPCMIEQDIDNTINRRKLQSIETNQSENHSIKGIFNALSQLADSGMNCRDIAEFLCIDEIYINEILNARNINRVDSIKNEKLEHNIIEKHDANFDNVISLYDDLERNLVKNCKDKSKQDFELIIKTSEQNERIIEYHNITYDFRIIVTIKDKCKLDFIEILQDGLKNIDKFKSVKSDS